MALPADAKFCVGCGRPVVGQAAPVIDQCRACGAKLEPGSQFCTSCGAPATSPAEGQPVPIATQDADTTAYLALLDQRMAQAGFLAAGAMTGLEANRIYTRQRYELKLLNKVTTFCAIKWMPGLVTADSIRLYSEALLRQAQAQRSTFSRITVQALFTYPVIVTNACSPDVCAYLEAYWPKHYMAFEFPVVVLPREKLLHCHRSTPLWGFAFHGGMLREAESLFTP